MKTNSVPRGTSTRFGKSTFLMVVLGALALSPSSQAAFLTGTTLIAPSGSSFLTTISGSPGTYLNSLSSAYNFSTSGGTDLGFLNTAVFRNPTGTLDFYYQVQTNAASSTPIRVDSNTSFTGFLTALGYTTTGGTFFAGTALPAGIFVNGTVAPVTGDRNPAPGQVVGFNFNPPPTSEIFPGSSSYVLVISTDAVNYVAGNASIQDGGNQTVAAFQPAPGTPGVPEPASIALFGAGLVALAGFRRFRRQS